MSIQSAKNLRDEYLKHGDRVREPHRIRFDGVDSYDVYNPSAPFTDQGRTYIAARVERRDTEFSTVRFFRQISPDHYMASHPDMIFDSFQDPCVCRIQGELVLGGVQVIVDPLNPSRIVSWHMVFYRGRSIPELRFFGTGPSHMKDIRLCELEDGRIGVFTRPQGVRGGLGKIGFTVLESLDDFSWEALLHASISQDHFLPAEWGGVNEVQAVGKGMLGVLGHIAFRDGEGLHYSSMAFVHNPLTGEHTPPRVIGMHADFPSENSKRPDLRDVLFTGGILRHGNGEATLYTGVSDCECWYGTIKDPFKEI